MNTTDQDQDREAFEAAYLRLSGRPRDWALAEGMWQAALAHERARAASPAPQGEPVAWVNESHRDQILEHSGKVYWHGPMMCGKEFKGSFPVYLAAPVAPPAESGEVERLISDAWDRLLNVGDRSSPEEYPEMALIQFDELAGFMREVASVPAPPPEPAKAEVLDAALWCAHVRGPDDVAAAASYDDAVALCDQINAIAKAYAHLDVMVVAYPALWPWDAQSHAANLAKGNDYRGPTLATPPTAPAAADVPPSALNEPDAWWAETGTSGAGDGCNKTFWLRHEAIAYVQQHGGHVAPLFRRWSDAAAADLGSAEPMILMPADATEEMLAATHDVNGHMRLLEFTNPEERSKPFLIMRACYRAMVDHVRKGGA